MKPTFLAALWLVGTISGTVAGRVFVPQATNRQETARHQAEELWEQAIAAKGGRERLHKVRNMLISSHTEYRRGLFGLRRGRTRTEQLYVFPNKYWYWDDLRPGVLGLAVSMYNGDTEASWLTYPDDRRSPRKLSLDVTQEMSVLIRAQLFDLMETKWVRPKPIKVRTAQLGGKRVDVVQAVIDEYLVDFYLDRETHLPLKVTRFGESPMGPNTELSSALLSEYADVDGIQMPHKIEDIPQRYRFNVDYDEALFEVPPTVEAGPEAWRPKKKH